MTWSFGQFLWGMLVFFFWFAVIWMFIAVFADILRADMSGWAKAGWCVLLVVLPFVGILIYLIVQPGRRRGTVLFDENTQAVRSGSGGDPVDEIAKAARLRDEGRITADEYEHLKHQALRF
jgi:phospholipase D-like protein